jgi:hypothetical protein
MGSRCAANPSYSASANVDDVPFDLRHLRVIVYEIREPDWGNKLRKLITDYLRNTIKDPSKSIPHPFRTFADSRSNGDEELENES